MDGQFICELLDEAERLLGEPFEMEVDYGQPLGQMIRGGYHFHGPSGEKITEEDFLEILRKNGEKI